MNPHLLAMLSGLFLVPAMLLWLGHRLRRRSARARGIFWGALLAHLLVAPAAMWVAMVPPVSWGSEDTVRGALGFWALLVAPAIGAVVGALTARANAP